MNDDHVSLREAARLVGLSKDTVWLAIQREELSSVLGDGPSGAQYWLKREEVQAWNERRKSRRRRSTPSIPHSTPSTLDPTLSASTSSTPSAPSTLDQTLSAPINSGLSAPSTVDSTPSSPESPDSTPDLRLALEVAGKTLDQNRELLAQLAIEKELRERAERQTIALASELGQYRRALAEVSESLAETRALAQAAELAANVVHPSDQVEEITIQPETQREVNSGPRTASPTARTGWGSRMRRWFLGERTG